MWNWHSRGGQSDGLLLKELTVWLGRLMHLTPVNSRTVCLWQWPIKDRVLEGRWQLCGKVSFEKPLWWHGSVQLPTTPVTVRDDGTQQTSLLSLGALPGTQSRTSVQGSSWRGSGWAGTFLEGAELCLDSLGYGGWGRGIVRPRNECLSNFRNCLGWS